MIRNLKVTRPILRYHGGKFILADWIISNFPEHRVYTETFGGGASVLLKKKRTYAEIYNDLDGEVVNLFKVVRDNGDDLIKQLENTPFSREEFNNSYTPSPCNLENARRTVIRSFMGFGSGIQSHQKTGFRANSNRSGSTPAHDWFNLPRAFSLIIERLKGVIIENRNYLEVAQQHDRIDTLHFFDPPYVLDTRYKGQSTKVYKFEMTDNDHEAFCFNIMQLSGMSVICAYENDIYNDILKDFIKISRMAYADGAKKRIETLYLSPNMPKINPKLF